MLPLKIRLFRLVLFQILKPKFDSVLVLMFLDMKTDDVVYTRSCRISLIKIPENKAMKIAKTGVLLLSITVLMTSVFLTQEAFGGFATCADCRADLQQCLASVTTSNGEQDCRDTFQECILFTFEGSCPVGGSMIQMETISILAAGAQYTAAWMIPTLIAAAGIGIVIARKL